MVVYFGSDHGGFEMKARLMEFVKNMGYEISDMGALAPDPTDDYPKFAAAVAEKVSAGQGDAKGILLCRSGAGMDIVANKFEGVRSVLGVNADQVFDSRHDDDVNILTIAAEFITPEVAEAMARVFLETPYAHEERFERRLDEIKKIENG